MRVWLLLALGGACVKGTPSTIEDDAPPDDAPIAPTDAPGCAPGATGCVATLPLDDIAGSSATRIYTVEPQSCNSVQPLCTRLSSWNRSDGVIRPVLAGASHPITDGTTLVVQGTYVDLLGTLPEVVACPLGNCAQAVPLAGGIGIGLMGAYGGTAYIIDGSTGDVFTCPETGCVNRTVIIPGPVSPPGAYSSFVVDASGAYLTRNGEIVALPPGGPLTTILSGTADLILDDTLLYLRTQTSIVTCPKTAAACTPSPRITGSAISAFQADTTKLYWKDGDDIYSCAKPACATPTVLHSCPANATFFADDDFVYCVGPATTLQIAK